MSLDVYLNVATPVRRDGSGIFVRENGHTVEISEEEWNRRNPGRLPARIEPQEESTEVYSANITHNLGRMAREAGIYEALWCPAKLDPERRARIHEQEALKNYHGAGGSYEIENAAVIVAKDLIQPLTVGLETLRSDPERFKAFNPSNGWGDYEGLVTFVADYLAACIAHPDATVSTWR